MRTIIDKIFPSFQKEYNARPDFLDGLEIDIYIPTLKIGFEYNEQQHYKPVNNFGGVEQFEHQKYNDKRKNVLCKQNGIRLITIPYTMKVTKDNVNNLIQEAMNNETTNN